ncbi:hypothetical protein [Streptococcus pluranimalium]|uniref:Uncharacterized protein n=1 Tax=Streptococcus pluranimalium TaxID=82348 RepID=A0A2L0D3F0_9STRE|nr:hypothetical protein [Streptococcus pluranimalium]AUW96353.1 hypothetical protein C0J00_04090 [Streptococcus pluranimalium]
MVTAAGLTVVLSAVGVTFAPISIGAVTVGVAGAMIFNGAYEKIEWVKDGTDFVSDNIDESVSAIGDVFQDSWKSIKNWVT